MHPEVKYSLLILLYAVKNYKIYNYSIQYIINIVYRNIVTILYIWVNQQDKLLLFNNNNNKSSETTSNNTNILYKKEISKHISKHKKPLNDNELGYYLAGLIDGNSDFSKGYLIITYNIKDKSIAYWLKSQINYGSISNINNKNIIKYVISNSKGILKVLELINGKLKLESKYNEILNNVLLINDLKYDNFIIDKTNDFNNYWLSGFLDSYDLLKINIINNVLNIQIIHKDIYILNKIQYFLCNNNNNNNGCIISIVSPPLVLPMLKQGYTGGIDNNHNIYSLEIASLQLIKNVICYLNKYPLLSYKYLNYVYFYKIYILIKNKEYLNEKGILKIKRYKDKMIN